MSLIQEQSPVNDFDNYVNHQWKAENSIPKDRSRWGTIDVMREENLERQRQLLESTNSEADETNLAKRLYSCLMREPTERSPVLMELVHLTCNEMDSTDHYLKLSAYFFTNGVPGLLHLCKMPDSKDPDTYVPHIYATGILLPDRDYYTDKPELHEPTKKYIIDLCQAFGITVTEELANDLFEFEQQLALKHYTRTERRDPDLTYNARTQEYLLEHLPAYFGEFFSSEEGLSGKVVVANTHYLEWLPDFIAATPLSVLRLHLQVHLLDRFVNHGPEEVFNIGFNFDGKLLSGKEVPQPRWKRSIETVNSLIGDELGKLYAAKYFDQTQQERCSDLISFLKLSYREIIQKQTWMSDETKTAALAKLDQMKSDKVGVPSKWHSVEGLWEDYEFNDPVKAIQEWGKWDWHHEELAKFYTPVDRDLWHMTPQTINACYDPLMNEILFPAGILQNPFFGESTIANFGAIGVVIGHEMTHGFDDQGSKYTADGKLQEWWTESDRTEFEKLTEAVSDHYSNLIEYGKNINGKLTLGENIADIGGLRISLNGLQMKFGRELTSAELEEFFRAYATIWRGLIREKYAHKLLTLDPHSPCSARINAALVHIREFRELYNLKSTDKMYLPKDKVMQIW